MVEATGRRPSSRCAGSRRTGVVVALLSLPALVALVAGGTGATEPDARGPVNAIPTTPTTEETPVPSEPAEPEPRDRTSLPGDDQTAAPAVVTEEHSGRTFSLPLGTEAPVRLDCAWAWDQPAVDGRAVTVTPVDPAACPPRTVRLAFRVP